MVGGPLGALAPGATVVAGHAAGLWLEREERGMLGFFCFNLGFALLIGLPIGAAAAVLTSKFRFFPDHGRSRELADFGVAFLGGTLLPTALFLFAVLDDL
ncbi:hypothetical protein LzC2_02450 [Planctomycetes bacterium LzC2]|uniref:Uncharacterized protein n=2 Tax=Alienimonas chondri TaxID=2681879 RepID=A0ABX1V7V9_9PLAN|nr:hypothetical protein [Alienimonas chondri]